MRYYDFFIMKECKVLKWPYKIALWSLILLVTLILALQLNSFLSKNNPLPSKVLIVEGWLPDDALVKVVALYRKEGYTKMITTGGPLGVGSYLKEYKDYAHLAEATLLKLGMPRESLVAVAANYVKRDRTYHSALVLKEWMQENGMHPQYINLASLGPHSRRSSILFQKAFASSVEVGSISISSGDYESKKWYTSSTGVRVTINEFIAYVYVLLLK